MTTLEQRLKAIEDRFALEDTLTAYCEAIDSLSDMDGLLACFTEDAVLDLSGLDLPVFNGHEGIRGFFQQVFDDMSHHAHYASNFVIERLDGDEARCRAYVTGMGDTPDGRGVLVYVKYWLDYARTPLGWKIAKFDEAALMPMGDGVTNIHGRE